jgi:hypothetical protein
MVPNYIFGGQFLGLENTRLATIDRRHRKSMDEGDDDERGAVGYGRTGCKAIQPAWS